MTPIDIHPQHAETAPSEVRADEPTLARLLGAIGLGVTLLGVVGIIGNQYSPRIISPGWSYFAAAIGLALMLYHAIRDGDIEFRRAYGAIGLILLILAAVAAVVPGPVFGEQAKTSGYHLLPWTPTFALLSLAFLAAPLRRETVPHIRNLTLILMLGVGGLLCVGSIIAGIATPDWLVGPGILLALVGLAWLGGFLSNTDNSEGIGHFVAVALGVLGAAALVYALGRAIWPTVLHEGPAALKNAFQTIDTWKLIGRLVLILLSLGLAVWGLRARGAGVIARSGLVATGLAFAGVFIYGSFAAPIHDAPKTWFVPYGLLLGLIGVIYLSASLACASDSVFIALVRREIAAFFFSPIAYILLGGMALVSSYGYIRYLAMLDFSPEGIREPILQYNLTLEIIAAIAVLFVVPALTMRAFSEEKRNATLEMLLTAPVSETSVVLSKFIACWLMYMVSFIPAGLYLIALRVEGGPFDYRPLLSYYLAVAACGVAFVGMGLFFSSITSNQIIAASLTFVGMLFYLLTFFFRDTKEIGRGLQLLITRFDFLKLWGDALSGTLPVTNAISYASLGVFWLFLTVKVLEARKWS